MELLFQNDDYTNVTLCNITGSWTNIVDCKENKNGSWKGRILLYDENGFCWFVGIVNDANSSNEDRLVYGIYAPDLGQLCVFKQSPKDVSKHFIFRTRYHQDNCCFTGGLKEFNTLGELKTMLTDEDDIYNQAREAYYGFSRINIDELGNESRGIRELKKRLTLFSDDYSNLYSVIYNNRHVLYSSILLWLRGDTVPKVSSNQENPQKKRRKTNNNPVRTTMTS